MKLKLICVGKIKEAYLKEGIAFYLKRIKAFLEIEVKIVKEGKFASALQNRKVEGDAILGLLQDSDELVSLCIEGENLASAAIADKLQNFFSYSNKTLTFAIGSVAGLSDAVKARSAFKLSLGKNTYPYQLVRLIFLEQLYRALTIIHHQNYHQ